MMENDNGDPAQARLLANNAASASIIASAGFSRADRVSALIHDISSMLKTPTGYLNVDDFIDCKELRLKASDLKKADAGVHAKKLLLTGDGGQYRLRFELKASVD